MGRHPAAGPRPGLPANVVWLGVVSFLNDFSSDLIYPLLPVFFTVVLGAGPELLGAMEGLVDALSSFLKLWSGRLGDRLRGRKPLVLAGYALASAARPFLALAAAPWQVIGIRLVDRTGKGIRGAPRDALIADSVDPSIRGRAFGFHRALDHLGAIAGPLAALVLIPLLFGPGELRERDYRVLFALAAVPAIVAVAVLVFCVREKPRVAVRRPQAYEKALGGHFWRLLGILALFALGNSSDAFLLLRARDLGLSATGLYLLWTLIHVVRAALSVPAGALSDRVPRRYLIAAGWLVYAAVYFGFGQATAAWHIWALFAAYGVYTGLVEGSERALVADLVPAEARGTAYGWYYGAVGLTAFPASALFGLLWSRGGPPLAFGFGAVLALLAALLLLAAGEPKGSRAPAG